jgi:hypothetical protein
MARQFVYVVISDYKVSINPAAAPKKYPIPTVEDIFEIFAGLVGGKVFSKLNMSEAYAHFTSLLTLVINFGYCKHVEGTVCRTKLPYGVSAAPTVFHKEIEKVLSGVNKKEHGSGYMSVLICDCHLSPN